MIKFFKHLARVLGPYPGATSESDFPNFDPEKSWRCRSLGQLDRQMTSAEWAEYGELVRAGY